MVIPLAPHAPSLLCTLASLSCFRVQVGEWGEKRGDNNLDNNLFLFTFSGSQTPHSQCNHYNKESLAEEAIMHQSGEGVHNLRGQLPYECDQDAPWKIRIYYIKRLKDTSLCVVQQLFDL